MVDRPENTGSPESGTTSLITLGPETAQDARSASSAEQVRLQATASQLPGVEFITGLFTGRGAESNPQAGTEFPSENYPGFAAVGSRQGLIHQAVADGQGGIRHTFSIQNARGELEAIHNAIGTTAEQAEQALESYRTQMQQNIESHFNVRFRSGGVGVNGQAVNRPDIWALAAISDGLRDSAPALANMAKPVNIELNTRVKDESRGEYYADRGDGPTVVLNATNRNPALLQNTVNHEMAHLGQDRLPQMVPGYEQELASALGFTRVDRRSDMNDFVLHGTDGNYYRKIHDNLAGEENWARVNADGIPLTADGLPTEEWQNAQRHSNADVRNVLSIQTVTPYIDDPYEIMADTLAIYRADESARANLQLQNPQLYTIAHAQHELEVRTLQGG